MTAYIVRSAEPPDRAPVYLQLSTIGDPDGNGTHGAVLTYSQEPDGDLAIYPNLEDMVRLGRLAQALIEGRVPAARNYDEVTSQWA